MSQGKDLIRSKKTGRTKGIVVGVTGPHSMVGNPNPGKTISGNNLPGQVTDTDNAKHYIQLDLAKGEFPELEVFKNLLFEVDETFRPLKKKEASVVWEDVKITRATSPVAYYLVFKSGNDSCRYLVHPVIGKSDIAKNAGIYEKYQQLRQIQEKIRKDTAATVGEKITTDKKALVMEKSSDAEASEEVILRSFRIQQFGIWNCDQVRKIANERDIEPVVVVEDTIFRQVTYLVDDQATSLNRIYPGMPLKFDEKANNTLWLVTYDNKIAVYTPTDFKSLSKSNPRCRLNMRLLKTRINNAGDFITLYKSGFSE